MQISDTVSVCAIKNFFDVVVDCSEFSITTACCCNTLPLKTRMLIHIRCTFVLIFEITFRITHESKNRKGQHSKQQNHKTKENSLIFKLQQITKQKPKMKTKWSEMEWNGHDIWRERFLYCVSFSRNERNKAHSRFSEIGEGKRPFFLIIKRNRKILKRIQNIDCLLKIDCISKWYNNSIQVASCRLFSECMPTNTHDRLLWMLLGRFTTNDLF